MGKDFGWVAKPNILFVNFWNNFSFQHAQEQLNDRKQIKNDVKQNVSKHKYFSAEKHLHFEIDMKKKTTP